MLTNQCDTILENRCRCNQEAICRLRDGDCCKMHFLFFYGRQDFNFNDIEAYTKADAEFIQRTLKWNELPKLVEP